MSVSRRNASYGHGEHRITTLNELPSPQGSWQTHYDAQQRKYNAHLALGIATLVGTIIVARASGYLYFNYSPPSRPADN